MNIDTMPAGRELDALVAEKVMGFPSGQRHGEIGEDSCGRPFCHDCGETDSWGDHMFQSDCVKFYSTSIAAAWEVVPHLKSCTIWQMPNGQYRVTLWREDEVELTADTAPLAIVRVALKVALANKGSV